MSGLAKRLLAAGACLWATVAIPSAGSAQTGTPPTGATPSATANPAIANPDYDALFKRMFAHPSDLDVTFRFAEMATQLGDYEAAIGALERMLFFNPKLPRVRLELGVLYFKLGSYAMARTYFDSAIEGDNVPPEVRAKVEAYLAEISGRLSPTKFSVFAQMGYRYQTNANAGPSNLIVRAIGSDAVLNSQFAKAPDWNWFGQTVANYAYSLGNQRGDSVEASFVGYYAGQMHLTQFDLGVAELQVGPRMPFAPGASLKVYGIGNALSLANSPYLYTEGAGASIRADMAPFGLFEPMIEYRHQDFQNSAIYPTSSEQSGHLVTAALGMDSKIAEIHWVGRIAYSQNSVNDSAFIFNNYDRIAWDFGLPWDVDLPWGGESHKWIVTPVVGGSSTRYAAPNPIVDPFVTRSDREIHYGGIIEGPLYKNLGLRVQILESVQHSSLPNYDFRNFSISFGPTARF